MKTNGYFAKISNNSIDLFENLTDGSLKLITNVSTGTQLSTNTPYRMSLESTKGIMKFKLLKNNGDIILNHTFKPNEFDLTSFGRVGFFSKETTCQISDIEISGNPFEFKLKGFTDNNFYRPSYSFVDPGVESSTPVTTSSITNPLTTPVDTDTTTTITYEADDELGVPQTKTRSLNMRANQSAFESSWTLVSGNHLAVAQDLTINDTTNSGTPIQVMSHINAYQLSNLKIECNVEIQNYAFGTSQLGLKFLEASGIDGFELRISSKNSGTTDGFVKLKIGSTDIAEHSVDASSGNFRLKLETQSSIVHYSVFDNVSQTYLIQEKFVPETELTGNGSACVVTKRLKCVFSDFEISGNP